MLGYYERIERGWNAKRKISTLNGEVRRGVELATIDCFLMNQFHSLDLNKKGPQDLSSIPPPTRQLPHLGSYEVCSQGLTTIPLLEKGSKVNGMLWNMMAAVYIWGCQHSTQL